MIPLNHIFWLYGFKWIAVCQMICKFEIVGNIGELNPFGNTDIVVVFITSKSIHERVPEIKAQLI